MKPEKPCHTLTRWVGMLLRVGTWVEGPWALSAHGAPGGTNPALPSLVSQFLYSLVLDIKNANPKTSINYNKDTIDEV